LVRFDCTEEYRFTESIAAEASASPLSIRLFLGTVHKRRPQSGVEGLSSADMLQTRGSSDAEFCIFGAKNFGFFKHEQEGEPCSADIFQAKGAQIFAICADALI